MKKQLLILGLCAMALSINAQTNLVANGDFETEQATIPEFAKIGNVTVNSGWYYLNEVLKGGTSYDGSTIAFNNEGSTGKCMSIQNKKYTTSQIFKAALGQRIILNTTPATREVYVLSFDAKSVEEIGKIRAGVRAGTGNYFKIDGFDEAGIGNAAAPYSDLGNTVWKHCSFELDFARTAKNHNSVNDDNRADFFNPSTDAELKNMHIIIANYKNATTILVDNISLIKKSEIPPTSIANNKKDANGLIIYTNGNNINVLNAKSVIEIYDISGKLIQKENSENFSIAQKGIYILKANNATQKLVIR